MTEPAVEVQPLVRQKAHSLGALGERWLAGLPGLIRDLERRWSIEVGRSLPGGSASYVARARIEDGRDAVLKLSLPTPDFAAQVQTLHLARGHGYAKLLAHDLDRHAMLQEALGPSMDRLGLDPWRQIKTLCAMLQSAWRVPRAPGLSVDPSQEKALALGELVGRLWEGLGRPCSERVVAQALTYAERRAAAFDPGRCVVVHGDPHPGNALRVTAPRPGAEAGFVFVDPDGFLADPAYDLGVVLRDWCGELRGMDAASAVGLVRSYCAQLSERTGVDQRAVWEWGFLERVSTGLYVLDFGAQELGRPFLDTAESLA
ncbi:aminoglycoside phosphotransferase family protein [Streptomyces durmitorensis]|uniref:Aminoglycoside phosphotransferase family protein n=1 Tax=Streptomyces durmitorensis TaxID=319947 RepID=A0ABY4PMG8_9ACTN|nr:aminoglycoside phosphotransferase family protein [Streptomyces durmitorensis]UQT54148.1 aminoglycoside phosphotransferase family protein [Streptomyces durmitorensis]